MIFILSAAEQAAESEDLMEFIKLKYLFILSRSFLCKQRRLSELYPYQYKQYKINRRKYCDPYCRYEDIKQPLHVFLIHKPSVYSL